MSLEDVFEPFPDAIGVDVCKFTGPDEKDDEAAPPRITWDPIEAEHEPPRRMGGGPGDDGPLMTRRWFIKVDIWGEDLTATEALTDLFLAVAHRLLTQYTYRPGKEKWNVGGVSGKGAVCTMLIAIERPILRVPARTATLKSIRASMGIANDSPATPVVSTFTKET